MDLSTWGDAERGQFHPAQSEGMSSGMFSTRISLHRLAARRLFWVLSLSLTVIAVAVVGGLIASAAPQQGAKALARQEAKTSADTPPGQAKRNPTTTSRTEATPVPAVPTAPSAAPTATAIRTATSRPIVD